MIQQLFLLMSFLPNYTSTAQPLFNSRQLIAGFEILADAEEADLFYYVPAGLQLATLADGRPDLQILHLRYTGAAHTGDQGAARFVNQLQFRIRREDPSAKELATIKTRLGSPHVRVRPLPLKRIETALFSPLGRTDDRGKAFRKLGSTSAAAKSPTANSMLDLSWRERVFTLRLEHHEAQILQDQVEKGRLALSFSYAYFAEGKLDALVPDGKDQESSSLLTNGVLSSPADTASVTRMIRSAALPMEVDLKKWPGIIRSVDVDAAEWLSTYAKLRLQCYDFSHELRPDLFMKQVEIKAYSAGGTPIISKLNFSKQAPHQTQQFYAPTHAVQRDASVEYRVIEYQLDGQKRKTDWRTHPGWGIPINISTTADELPFDQRSIELEIDPESWLAQNIEQLTIEVTYTFQKERHTQSIVFPIKSGNSLQSLNFLQDRATTASYQLSYQKEERNLRAKVRKIDSTANYLYISAPRG
ncbi:MAG: hypothetical protein KTR30_29880 [Saprospiraceae bacterium]|nr:hypothetical protein [Saprospiraceae bacterium]